MAAASSSSLPPRHGASATARCSSGATAAMDSTTSAGKNGSRAAGFTRLGTPARSAATMPKMPTPGTLPARTCRARSGAGMWSSIDSRRTVAASSGARSAFHTLSSAIAIAPGGWPVEIGNSASARARHGESGASQLAATRSIAAMRASMGSRSERRAAGAQRFARAPASGPVSAALASASGARRGGSFALLARQERAAARHRTGRASEELDPAVTHAADVLGLDREDRPHVCEVEVAETADFAVRHVAARREIADERRAATGEA